MMSKIGIVTASSDKCLPFLYQCLVSLDISVSSCVSDHTYDAYVYECNWQPSLIGTKQPIFNNWNTTIDICNELPLKHIQLHQKKSSNIKDQRDLNVLPDIAVYDDFSQKYINSFDYVLFCHNDVQFSHAPFIDLAIDIVNDPECCMIAEPTIQCNEHLTIRYRPHFIFIHADKFIQAGLSFINNYCIQGFNIRHPRKDGGAGLLLSQYHLDRPIQYKASNKIPKSWLNHMRFYFTDAGIESYNLTHSNTPEFNQVSKLAQEYVDKYLWSS